MHLLEKYGYTCRDVVRDGYRNVYCAESITYTGKMDIDLANTIICLNSYLNDIKPYLVVVHGDRIEALAGSISGMLNNILVAHIEGGEVTGTVDESIRHSISKMAQYHFVANIESKIRLLQLGEREENIFVIGSPDIDIMLSELPDINMVKTKYNIEFNQYAILMYHPVTTELEKTEEHIRSLIKAAEQSKKNYIIIYPNNDLGSNIIISEIERNKDNGKFRIFRSLPFEDFLSLLKNAQFIMGNSSAGIREACVYGVPAIDIGTRQQGRYKNTYLKNIQHTTEEVNKILNCTKKVDQYRFTSSYFGKGNSSKLFVEAMGSLNETPIQKKFVDTSETQEAIKNYINEVCF